MKRDSKPATPKRCEWRNLRRQHTGAVTAAGDSVGFGVELETATKASAPVKMKFCAPAAPVAVPRLRAKTSGSSPPRKAGSVCAVMAG